MRRLRLAAALAAAALGAAAAVPANARMTIIYDQPGIHDLLVQPGPNGEPGLSEADQAFQQQPTFAVLGPQNQAWKVSGATGTRATPTLINRGPDGMARLLRDRVRRSGGKLVFIDELGARFRGSQGADLSAAMRTLEGEASPAGESYARRVHVYVLAPAEMVALPDQWAGAWEALVRSGGVWLEAYYRSEPWNPEQWLAWPGAFAREFVARGGDPSRLHLLLTGDTVDEQLQQWSWARTGDACPLLANGPGAYRVDTAAPVFVQEFRRTFGTEPAPVVGPSAIACTPAPILPPEQARALSVPFSTDRVGYVLGRGALGSPRLYAGIRQTVTVRLGSDPLGLAAALGMSPSSFWSRARAVVRLEGEGWRAAGRLGADGVARIPVTPPREGPIRLRLIVPSTLIRAQLGSPKDLVGSFHPYAAELGPLYGRMIRSPRSWSLSVPLGLNGRNPADPALYAYTAPAPEQIRTIALSVTGNARTRTSGGATRRWRLVLMQARTAQGVPVPAARLSVRRPDGARRIVRTDIRGRARVLVPWVRGRVVVRVLGVPGSPVARLGLNAPRRRG